MEPKTTSNMSAECVTRNSKGKITSTTSIAVPAGLTHDEAVAFVRKYNNHEIAQFVEYSFSS